jgi:catechol 2,3-dioxygenase-like lactoylglutathione lyase family enzyme
MRLLEVHLEVADVERSVRFYSNLLAHRKIDSWDEGTANAIILEDGAAFGIWKKGKRGIHGGQGGEHIHFAFQISPDEYTTYKRKLEDLGMKVQEHTWPNGHRSVYFVDYDGHQGEFMTVDWLGLV